MLSGMATNGFLKNLFDRDQVYVFNRRFAEYTCYNVAGTLTVMAPPGFSGSPPLNITTTGVSEGYGTNVDIFFFVTQITMKALGAQADIINMFAQYQFRRVRFEFQLLNASNYVAPTAAPYIPEVTTAYDPTAVSAPLTMQAIEAYGNCARGVLDQATPLTVDMVPRIPLSFANGTQVGFLDGNQMWVDTAGTATTWGGGVGALRNFAPNGCAVRITGQVEIATRRPL